MTKAALVHRQPPYTPGDIVVIRGGTDVAGGSRVGMFRAESVAQLLAIDGDVATVKRTRGRGGRYQHWNTPIAVPLAAVVRLASRRELVLGYPSPDGPALRPVATEGRS